MENETFDEYLKRKTFEKNNAFLQIKRSNSDTKFYKIKHYSEKTRRKIQKSKTITKEILAKRQHSRCSSCEHCHTVSKLIKKDKRRLRDYILDNKKYVKLIGNRRYNDNPPALYIQDHNKNLDDKKIGLIPLPTKSKKKIKSNSDKQRLYDLQRSIVMMRRFQYNKQYLNNDFKNNNNFINNIIDLDCVIIIQKWWKKIFKIIKIQKIWRGHFIRKEIYAVRKLYFFMEKFENTLNEIKVKKCFNKIKNFENLIFQKPKINSNFNNINNNFESFGVKNNDYFFMTKKTNLINEKLKHKIITIQKNYKNHFNFVKNLILNKDKIKKHLILNYFFITKIYINPLLINNKICLIQKYFHQFLLTKKKFKKKIVFPLQYTKKIYQRPTLTVKKIQKFYKNYQNKKEFNNILNEDDFNKIIYNQNKPNSFFTKITINKNSIENYLNNNNNNNNINNNNYNLIENKFSKIIFPFTNKICFISKEYKTSFMNKLLKLQKYIKKWANKNIETSLLNIDYKSTGYYSQKIRTRNNLNNILFLQTSIKGYLNKKNEIIKEKPINSSSILFNNDYNNNDDTINEFNLNNNNNNFNNNNNEFILSTNSNKEKNLFNKNNINYENSNMNYSNLNNSNLSNLNNSDFVSKKNIKNVNDKVIKLQRKIKSYLILKKIKENKNDINNYKQIKKNNLNKFYFITKTINNKTEQMNKITLIQKYFRSKINNNKNIIKKHLVYLTTPLIKRTGDLTEIDINFSDENSNNNFSVDEINLKKKKNNNDSLISNESKINKTFLNNNNNNYIFNEELNSSFLNNSGYISKVVKKNVKKIKKNNLNELSFISKKVFIEKNNYELYNDFFNFIELLITKHFQEKIFYLLKNNTNHFNKCFYIKTLKKVLKFHQIYKNKENKVSKFINKIFPNLNNSNINKLISKLNDEQKNDLANTNIFENNLDQDFIKYLNDFSLFDKNLSNELFTINRLKNSYLTNTNIFSITKFIDNEYENLIEGKYCMKCYQTENICDCLQKNLEIEESFNFNVNTKNLEDEFEEIIKKDLPEFSGYISKIIIKPTNLIKKEDLNHLFFISKTFYIKQNPEINIDYIKLLNLHLIKNTQQFVFYKLKLFKEIDFNNSFYVLTLQRILKYCKSNPKKQSKVQTFINNVFPNINNKTINKLISNLTQEQQKQLSNSNIYTSIDQDFIKYLNDFSLFDKNLSNEQFITNRLKNSNLTNTNIFSITKFIDNEYENLIEGKYCMKCYQTENICDCLQKKTFEDEEDYTIDLEMNDDDASKCIVNHFEYDSTKVKGILIKRKPKIEENYEDPITNLINKRKYFTTNNSKENEKKKSSFVFKSNFNNNSNNLISSQNENNNNNNIIENNFLFNSNNNINVIASNDSINNSLSNNNINNNRYNNNNINVNNSDSINIGNSQEFVTNAQNRNNNIIDLKKLYHSDKNNKKANQVIIRGDNNSNNSNGSNDKNNLKYFY